MRIKIIGDNNCARATRHLLRLAGFAVTEYLPVDAVTHAPHSGYAITIDLAPAPHNPDPSRKSLEVNPSSKPEQATHGQPAATKEEALSSHGGASSRLFIEGESLVASADLNWTSKNTCPTCAFVDGGTGSRIHFDSVDSALEAAVLRHVTQLATGAVIVDRPGGLVHSERELRIVVPCTGDAKADEAAAVAVEFGVLRGLLDLTSSGGTPNLFHSDSGKASADSPAFAAAEGDVSASDFAEAGAPEVVAGSRKAGGSKKKWWTFGVALIAGLLLIAGAEQVWGPHVQAAPRSAAHLHLTALAAPAPEPQGQFATGQFFDPCKVQTKLYVSISQTANTQIVAGTASKKIYVCSIHVVVAAATNVALVEGTGTVCGTGTAGVGGFGGATAATGWNFAANGGIAFGNGDSSLGAEVNSADNLCVLNSGSGQVSGGITYVVQ